jgi:TldD protein
LTPKIPIRLALLFAAAFSAAAQHSALLDAMSQELNRNFNVLKGKADPPPYFLSYEVTEVEFRTVSGTLGTVDPTSQEKSRTLDVSVRVGSAKLDNYHRVRGQGGAGQGRFTSGATLTFEDSPNSIKRELWLETDRAYRAAAERLIRINTNTQVRVAESDDSDDFSSEPPSVFEQKPLELKFDEAAWR